MNKRTLVKLNFQYMPKGSDRPLDHFQEELLDIEVPYGAPISALPFPAPGDTVSVSLGGAGIPLECYKVLTRHFTYFYTKQVGLEIRINIVVADVSDEEMAKRIKG